MYASKVKGSRKKPVVKQNFMRPTSTQRIGIQFSSACCLMEKLVIVAGTKSVDLLTSATCVMSCIHLQKARRVSRGLGHLSRPINYFTLSSLPCL